MDLKQRYELLGQAEAIMTAEAPLIPIYHYTRVYNIQPNVKNWHSTFLDHHPYKYVYLEVPAK